MTRLNDPLDAERLRGLFQEVSDRLEERGEQASLFVVGGAAMALAYDQQRVTRDVDALFEPRQAVRQIVEQLATKHDLPADWLNDAAKGFMPVTTRLQGPYSSPSRCTSRSHHPAIS